MRRSHQDIRQRLAMAGLLFLFLFAAVAMRAFHLQIMEGETLKRLGEKQHLTEWIVLPKRGTVYDRAGESLAVSLEAQSVYARPRRLKEPEAVAPAVARVLSLNAQDVLRRLKSDKPFVWLKRQVTPREAAAVQSMNLDGLGMYYETRRYYPQGQLAGQVIGFVGTDSQGLEGVERHYDSYIRGSSGAPVVERDALGRRVLVRGLEELKISPGADIYLTLDTSIQYLAEKQLEIAVQKFRAKGGIAVVVEPFTGAVLAMANYPFFNPNNYSRDSLGQRRNRSVTDSFEPGSTFKSILAAAALEEGVVGKEDLFYCEFGKYAYGGRIIHDSHPFGWLPFYQIIQHSSNIGATKVAQKLKKERYFKYIEKFGFGQVTGIDIPGEVPGMVRSADKWSAIDLATHAFGQGISVTPIQLVMAYAAIANGGLLMRPFLVRRVTAPNGDVLISNQPHVVRRVISQKTASLLTSILKGVVSDSGTGVMASVEGFEVAGKTGTAQKPDLIHGGYAARKRVGSFIGFVPADNPRMVLLVLIDEPEVNVYGGVVAAPAFRDIAQGVLRYLGVAPEKAAEPSLRALPAETHLERAEQTGERKMATGDNGHEVPDFIGLSLRQALGKASALNLKLQVRGSGYVVEQSPAPGASWGEDEILTLNLQG